MRSEITASSANKLANKLANLPICQFANLIDQAQHVLFVLIFHPKGDGAAAMAVAAATVANGLRSEVSRIATLDTLDDLPPPIPSPVVLAAAPALVDAMAMETARASLDRCGLLLARLLDEAAPDPAALYGAALGGDRLAALFAPALLVEAVQRALEAGQPLTRDDAMSAACLTAIYGPAYVRGYTAPEAAAGRTMSEYMGIVSCLVHSLTTSSFPAWRSPWVALSARSG